MCLWIGNALQTALKGLLSAQWGWGRALLGQVGVRFAKSLKHILCRAPGRKKRNETYNKTKYMQKTLTNTHTQAHTTKKCFVFNTKHLLRPHSCDSEKRREGREGRSAAK